MSKYRTYSDLTLTLLRLDLINGRNRDRILWEIDVMGENMSKGDVYMVYTDLTITLLRLGLISREDRDRIITYMWYS